MIDDYLFWNGDLEPELKKHQAEVRVIAEDVICAGDTGDIDLAVIKAKLIKARTQLILDTPFLGNLVLRLPLVVADNWCKTSATDAKNFYYNAAFIAKLTPEQTKFILIHEALHCALTHFARRGHRSKHRWDLACDFAINPLLVAEGFKPPPNAVIFRQYEGMLAEEIYPLIDDKLDVEPLDQHLYNDNPSDDSRYKNTGLNEQDLQQKPTDKSQSKPASSNNKNTTTTLAPKPKALKLDEIKELATQWQRHLASSAQLAKQANKLSEHWGKMVDFFIQPQLSWRVLLAQYLSMSAHDDFSYYRTSRRELANAILPSLRSEHIYIAVAIDNSGSISLADIDQFISEINQIKANLSAEVLLFACDDKLTENSPWHYFAWQDLVFPASLGGGKGTNFIPVFDYLNRTDNTIDVLVYFTDAKGIFPKIEPHYSTIWLVKGKEAVPWGRRIQLQ